MSTFPVSCASFSSSILPSSVVVDKNNSEVDVNQNNSHLQDVVRRSVNFNASIWGSQFLTYNETIDLAMEEKKVEEQKEEVRKLIMVESSSNEKIQHIKLVELIDVIQHLGIAYHLDEEIEKAMRHIYITYGEQWIDNNDLQNISLWFRLLRQQGFNVPSEIFKNYMDEKGFKESLCNDVEGMLGLYEASYMRVEGEEILDEALEFTKLHLGIIANDPCCDFSLKTQIQQALKRPLRKRLPRLEAVRYIPIYEQDTSHNEALLKLAKLDFKILQEIHKKELSQLCKWWNSLDLQNKLPYVRDRLIEGYFWILAIYFEPQHSRSRMFLVRTCTWLVVLDDTFDNYGTYEELEIFTQAVDRWSISCLDNLPEYMKLIYQELVNSHEEMEKSLENEGQSYHIHYVKEMAKEVIRNYFMEAKWLKYDYMPTLQEYMSVSVVTSTYALMIARCYVGKDNVTEDTFKWVATYPPIVKASCLIGRLLDDIASHKEEQERGHVASSIECYQKETSASEKEACKFILKQVEDAWKVINKELLTPTDVPIPLLMPAINLARVSDILYEVNDGYTHAKGDMVNNIKSLLVHEI